MIRLIALLIALSVAPATWAQNKIVLNTHDQAPLSYVNAKGELDGTAVKPVIYALTKMGWRYEFPMLPWIRAQHLVQLGEADGFFAASQNTERDSFAASSATIASQVSNWYLLKSNPLDPNSPDFKANTKVGSYQGTNMLKWLKDNGYNISGEPSDPEKLFLMLNSKRFDACLANDYNYDNFIKKHGEFEGKFRSVVQRSSTLHVYFSKKFIEKNPGFLAEFNKYVTEYTTRNK